MIIEMGGEELPIPSARNLMKTLSGDSIFVFGCDKDKFYTCVGIGTVVKIQKGDELDIVYMFFGKKTRQIVVKHNHARRQIYSLKRGQLAWFYGTYKNYGNKVHLYAKGFQAWYVPKAIDIKNYDLDSIEEMEKTQETDMINFLDQFEEK